MRIIAGAILIVGGTLAVLVGGFTTVYAGDVEGGEPAVGTGIAVALAGFAVLAAGIWLVRRSTRP